MQDLRNVFDILDEDDDGGILKPSTLQGVQRQAVCRAARCGQSTSILTDGGSTSAADITAWGSTLDQGEISIKEMVQQGALEVGHRSTA